MITASFISPPLWSLNRPKPILPNVIDDVCRAFFVSRELLVSQSRSAAYPRFAAYHIMRTKRGMSYSQIGRLIGGRDHSTAIAGCKRAEELLATDEDFARAYRRALR